MTDIFKDKLETMILMLMDGSHEIETNARNGNKDINNLGNKKKKHEYISYDISEMTRCDDMRPSSTYAVNVEIDQERMLAVKPEYLLYHPAEIVGDQLEVATFCGDYIKWIGYRKCKKAPKGISAVGVPVLWLESHFRIIYPDGRGTYMKNFVPVSRTGHAVLAKSGRAVMCNPIQDTVNLAVACSIFEDAHRINTMLASVVDSIELKLAIGLDSYKEIFALRDAPMTAAGRRKAIIHWVASHLRKSTIGNEHNVREHTRGIDEIVMDGIKIKIEPNNQRVPLGNGAALHVADHVAVADGISNKAVQNLRSIRI